MSLETIPTVVVDNTEGFKFITCKLYDGNGNEKIVVRANENYRYHFKLVAALEQEAGRGIKVHCLGGGQIKINPDAKTIVIWDKSTDYGKEPGREATTIALLQAAFPEFQVGERKSYFAH